jgi:hypothetical protein
MIRLLTHFRADVNAQDHDGLLPVEFSMNTTTTQQLFQLGSHQGSGRAAAKLSLSLSSLGSPASASPPSSPCSGGPPPRRGHRTFGSPVAASTGRASAPMLANSPAATSRHVASVGTPKALFCSSSTPSLSPISVVARSVAATP